MSKGIPRKLIIKIVSIVFINLSLLSPCQALSYFDDISYINILKYDGVTISKLREEDELGQQGYQEESFNKLNKKRKLDYTRVLKINSRGSDVRELSIALHYLGYDTNPNSWIYNYNTSKIVEWFQHIHGLKIDGLTGVNTLRVINEELNRKNIVIPDFESLVKKRLSNSYWIIIDKDTNVLLLYKGNKLVKRYPVATGSQPNKTPEGVFKIIKKAKNPHWGGGRKGKPVKGGDPKNPLGTRWLGLSYGDGLLYGIHGTNNPQSIGKHVSNGCIRMHNKDVEELYNIVSKDTKVLISTFNNLQRYYFY